MTSLCRGYADVQTGPSLNPSRAPSRGPAEDVDDDDDTVEVMVSGGGGGVDAAADSEAYDDAIKTIGLSAASGDRAEGGGGGGAGGGGGRAVHSHTRICAQLEARVRLISCFLLVVNDRVDELRLTCGVNRRPWVVVASLRQHPRRERRRRRSTTCPRRNPTS